jgi:aminopeptidase N
LALVAPSAAAGAGSGKEPLNLRFLGFAPQQAAPGDQISVRGKLSNSSDVRHRVRVRARLDATFVRSRRVRVPAGGNAKFTLVFPVPQGLAAGPHALGICAGRGGGQDCRSARKRLTVTGAAAPASPQQPSPGARTLGDPLFPEVGNGGYDALHYDVAIDWEDTGDLFEPGTSTTLTARATQALSELSLDLEGLTVGSVAVNGAAASFSRVAPGTCSPQVPPGPCPATKLVITPAVPIPDGSQFTVAVAYTGDPQRHIDPDGSDEGWVDTADGAFVVNEPVGAMAWMPCNNHPADKATYDFELTVPTGKEGIGNGELVSPPEDNGDGTTTWRWATEDPMATYLSTSTVGDFDFTPSTTTLGLPVYDFIHSGFTQPEKDLATVVIERQEDVIAYFTGIYGAYPFDSAGSVVDDADVGYALEVQTKAHYSSSTVPPTTFAHEIAHQWFGDSVTLTTWKDIWLNEGWAGWSEWIWDDEDNGSPVTPAQQFTVEFTPGVGGCPGNKWCTPPADPTAEGLFTEFPTYTRPAMMLEALHQIMGRANFLDLASDWHAGHRHGHGTTAQFIALAKDRSGFSGANLAKLDTFFQQWLFGTTMPTITGSNFF